jgi:hypothetical protein
MAAKKLPDIAYLRNLLVYDPDSGITRYSPSALTLSGKVHPSRGQQAGAIWSSGYLMIEMGGSPWRLHRIIWAIVTGEDTSNEIDHENLDRADNMWDNLREAGHPQNQQNQRRRSDNTTGFKGVWFRTDTKKFSAEICCNGNRERLGSFPSAEEAHTAYCEAAKRLHGEFFNPG